MAKIPGTNVASPIAPFTTDDQFPTHDAIYGKGGQREVATIAERDAIPSARLTEGCTCYVAATEKTYRWKSNAWVDDTPEIASDASDISYTPSGSGSTPTTVAGALDSLNESVSGLEDSVQDNADDIDDLQEGAVAVDVDTTTKVFAIKNAKGQNVGTITVSETTGLPATLTLAKAGTNGQSITVSLPTLTYNSQTQMLEYVDATGTHVPTIKLSNLQIKYVGSTDPSTGTWALGDLILVGSNSSYELKVYDGNSTWQPIGSINGVSLQADQVSFTSYSGLQSTDVKHALDEVNIIRNSGFNSELDVSDEDGNVALRLSGGHIKTKNFDSRDVENLPSVTDDDSDAELNFSDEDGNVAMQVKNGHIKTKNFDSENLDGDAINLPSYWKSYLNTKITSLKEEEDALGRNGAAFIFFSDVHWADNYKQSPSIIKYILRHTHIKDVICGGDLIVLYGNKAEKVSEMKEFCDAVSDIPCINIIGNHDYNTSDQPASSWDANRITPQEHYRIAMATSERGVEFDQLGSDDVEVTSDYNYPKTSYDKNSGRYPEYFGYCDNKSQKLRYIFLDSTCVHVPISGNGGYTMTSENLRISDNQLKWMQNRIKELDNTWTVVVFTHISLGKGYTQGDNTALVQIGSQIDAALTDESVDDENNAHIAAVVCGHNHRDTHSISSNGKFYFISTRSDARKTTQIPTDRPGDNNIASKGGDTSEQAIDIFFLDTENKTIKAKRVGAGDINGDRTFNYQ